MRKDSIHVRVTLPIGMMFTAASQLFLILKFKNYVYFVPTAIQFMLTVIAVERHMMMVPIVFPYP